MAERVGCLLELQILCLFTHASQKRDFAFRDRKEVDNKKKCRNKNLRSKPVLQNPDQLHERPSVLPTNHS